MEHMIKRCFSVFFVLLGVTLICVAIATDYWWIAGTPVRKVTDLYKSFIYFWMGLYEACQHVPNFYPLRCEPLQFWNEENIWMKSVRILCYIGLSFGCVEAIVILLMIIFKKKLLMDIIAVLSFLSGSFIATALSIYTEQHSTHVKIFVFFGYSYICGWLAVTSFYLSTLLAILARLNKDDVVSRRGMKTQRIKL